MNYVDKSQEVNKNREESLAAEISVKEFDAITDQHEFSQGYERRKEMLLKQYKEKKEKNILRTLFRVAAAVVGICVMGTIGVGVYAAVTHDDFFHNAFGNTGRESVAAHIGIQEDEVKGDIPVEIPAREYVEVDPEAAEDYLGNYMLQEPIVKKINDHTLTIISAVRDKNVMVMEFTLERKGGENALGYDEGTNMDKGAYVTEEADIYFMIEDGGDCIYVDLEKSTDEKLYCYDYITFDEYERGKGAGVNLTIQSADGSIIQALNSPDIAVHSERLEIPIEKPVPSIIYTSKEGGMLEVSAIGMSLDMGVGLGLTGDEKYDPGSVKTVVIKYKDGSEYLVKDDHTYNLGYSCGTSRSIFNLEDTNGSFGSIYSMVFNRLVETDHIKTIEINGIKYTKK